MASELLIRVDKNQRLRCVREGSNYIVRVTEEGRGRGSGRGRKRYWIGPAEAPISCTREVNKYLAQATQAHARARMEGGTDSLLARLPKEVFTRILDAVEPEDTGRMEAASSGTQQDVRAYWQRRLSLPIGGAFEAELARLSDAQLNRLEALINSIILNNPIDAQHEDPEENENAWRINQEMSQKIEIIIAERARRAA